MGRTIRRSLIVAVMANSGDPFPAVIQTQWTFSFDIRQSYDDIRILETIQICHFSRTP